MAKLWNSVTSLAIVAALAWVAWYTYSHWGDEASVASDSAQVANFNCRKALADLASDYACMNSESCKMTVDELSKLKNREVDIEQHCN